ncbi:hypothetical protein [Streptomyces durhamensis]|uniref:hypothetical protein n=1 Tax=Streptomyces durhamensis TaxID=68194 RepID=UPI0004CD2D99|nr:hypothetical protein [Streptomyces durhamensis]
MCGGVVLWIVGLCVAAWAGQTAGNLYVWGSLIGGGVWLWGRYAPERQARARQTASRERSRIGTEVREWERGGLERPEESSGLRPAPATVEPAGSGLEAIRFVRTELPSRPALDLPDPEQARRLCTEVVTGLVRSLAREAEAHAEALRPLAAGGGRRPGRYRARNGYDWGPVEEGFRLRPEAAQTLYRVLAWAGARTELLSVLHPRAAAETDRVQERGATLRRWRTGGDTVSEPPGTPVRPAGQWEDFLRGLREELLTAARGLRALPPFPAPPRLSPVGSARLRENMTTEVLGPRIAEYVDRHARRLATTPHGGFTMAPQDWSTAGRLLQGFVTDAVPDGFRSTTEGFEAVGSWGPDAVVPEVRSRMHRVHVTFGLHYLVEVLRFMPQYAENSGENGQGSRINIGVINIANSLKIINSNMAAVMQRGDTQAAEAVNALTAAVQADPDLAQEDRADHLENVVDVAAAVADPDADGNRRRGRNALAALSAAAGASSQITQVINEWQHVFGSLLR